MTFHHPLVRWIASVGLEIVFAVAQAPSNIGITGSLLTAISTFLIKVTIRDHWNSGNSGYGLISLHIITTITTSCCYPHHYPSYRYRNHSLPSSTRHCSCASPEAWVIVTMINGDLTDMKIPLGPPGASGKVEAVTGGLKQKTHICYLRAGGGDEDMLKLYKTPKWGRVDHSTLA